MRPFFPYYGSMWNRARYYPAPQHDVVIEPFAGSAGYSLFHECRRVDLFDLDPYVCGVWDYLLNVDPTEIVELPDMPEVGDNVDNYNLPQEAKWLIGYLAQKAATAAVAGNAEKAMHHTISTAAACANWHAALSGADTRMRPGIDPVRAQNGGAGASDRANDPEREQAT